MSKTLCKKAIEELDENVMLKQWFPLFLRDKIIEDIFNYYGFKEEDFNEEEKEVNENINS